MNLNTCIGQIFTCGDETDRRNSSDFTRMDGICSVDNANGSFGDAAATAIASVRAAVAAKLLGLKSCAFSLVMALLALVPSTEPIE